MKPYFYEQLNQAISEQSQDDEVWQNLAIVLMLECGYLKPEWLLAILSNNQVFFHHSPSMIHLFFKDEPHRFHLSISPELYLALTYLHEHPDL